MNLKNSGYVLVLMVFLCSCNQEQKDFNLAKDSESTTELESFITNYPGSEYVDSAQILIEKLIWQETLTKNTVTGYEDYLSNYPDGNYVDKVPEQLSIKKESLKLALETFRLAQQTTNKSEQEKLYSQTDSLFHLANFTEFILDAFKYPSKNLHISSDGTKQLSEFIERSFTTSYYLYGGSQTQSNYFTLKDDQINNPVYYKLMIASADITNIKLTVDLIRSGKVISKIGENTFIVNSRNYLSQIGFMYYDEMSSQPNDKIRFKIIASGSDYGMSCGNYESFIKVGQPLNMLDETVLSEREKAISWCVSNSKWSHPTVFVLDFISQLDYCVLHGKNGNWDIGWASQKNGLAYKVSWETNMLSIQELSRAEANEAGIKESTMRFSIE